MTTTDMDAAEPQVKRRRGPSLIWLVPLVAALLGAWMAYKTISERGPTVRISFVDGSGLEAGKTKVRYKAVEIGTVQTVHLGEGLTHVEVSAELSPEMADHLGADAKFWVVRPRVGFGGVSGLETLLSGAYVAFEPGRDKASKRDFVGLEEPPPIGADIPGRRFTLHAEALDGLAVGTQLQYRGIAAGEVSRIRLDERTRGVLIEVFVRAPFDALVRPDSHFWRSHALDASVGPGGVDVKVGSLPELLAGGIVFDSPERGEPAAEGHGFPLFASADAVKESAFTFGVPVEAWFEDSVRGLTLGAPVEFRGLQVGRVIDIRLVVDEARARQGKIPIAVRFEINPTRVNPRAPRDPAVARANLAELIGKGMSARLATGSLLTGALFVDLEFPPDAPKAPAEYLTGETLRMPALPALSSELQGALSELAGKLRRLPLDAIAEQLLGAAKGANRIANAPELASALRGLDATLKQTARLSGEADQQLARLGPNVDRTLVAVRTALQTLDPDSPLVGDLGATLEELAAAARTIRDLTDYLSRNPEALLYGKGGKEQKK